jgi:hypothetical protein
VLRTPASALSQKWLDEPVCLRVAVLFCCFAVLFDCRAAALSRLSLLFFGKEVHIRALTRSLPLVPRFWNLNLHGLSAVVFF